jgi:UTP--glucose-1-phosphate uridylyltransferase
MKGNEKIIKAVIPAAGLGTRLLPATKETPKEMLPIFAFGMTSEVCLKPLIQSIFEQLFDFGIRQFFFIVNHTKDSIIRHFSFDKNFLTNLGEKGQGGELNQFFKRVTTSSVEYVYQNHPRGFGDAVLQTAPYINQNFIVQAGDTYIVSERNRHLMKLVTTFEKYSSAATLLVQEVKHPEIFGVIEGHKIEEDVYQVTRVTEKPQVPPTNLAITGLYVFTPAIFKTLNMTLKDRRGELQLTDGIQRLIDSELSVTAVKLGDMGVWLDIGNPQTYLEALIQSYKSFSKKQLAN